ncbi:MAG: HD domain-containing protein [Spirochaetales bacterium]|nr:HD domain-containing protein [Spirochaetales bacterium]
MSISVEVLALSAVLLLLGTYRTFKAEAFLLYFIIIAEASLRFSVRLTIYAGISSTVCYLAIVGISLVTGAIEFGTVTESFISQRVSINNILQQITFLSVFALIMAFLARGYKMLVYKAVQQEFKVDVLRKEIEHTQKEIVFTLAETCEMRSKETGNHVKRVAEYSRLLALKCGLSDTEAEIVRLASPMHDIGKIAIPDSILLKHGPLAPVEMEIMKTHANLGFDLLRKSDRRILKASAIIAHEHHERWNGEGYPRKLCAEGIHIYGRIAALADVFDALGHDRCYKKAWDLERIIDYLAEEKGGIFDPSIVTVFMANIDEFLKINEMYREAV